jgi:hypothetical protein
VATGEKTATWVCPRCGETITVPYRIAPGRARLAVMFDDTAYADVAIHVWAHEQSGEGQADESTG